MRFWALVTVMTILTFFALRALAVAMAGEESFLSAALPSLIIFPGVLILRHIVLRRRAAERSNSDLGVESEWNASGNQLALSAGMVAACAGALWMIWTSNFEGLCAILLVMASMIFAFWIGRKKAS